MKIQYIMWTPDNIPKKYVYRLFCNRSHMVEGSSLEVKLPTIWTDEKQTWEESEKRRAEERRSEKKRSQKKEDPGARKGCVVPMICGSGGSRSRLAKAAGAEPAGQMKDEKLHAVVARSTCRSQNDSKCIKHTNSGPLLEVEMLRREAHFEVKM